MPEEKPNVLVVDDDTAITELMRDFLEAEGFAVETAGDSNAAYAILERTSVDCLLLDVMMPGQSGFDLCRRAPETSHIPLLFLIPPAPPAHTIPRLALFPAYSPSE